jgi:hypothetical protein
MPSTHEMQLHLEATRAQIEKDIWKSKSRNVPIPVNKYGRNDYGAHQDLKNLVILVYEPDLDVNGVPVRDDKNMIVYKKDVAGNQIPKTDPETGLPEIDYKATVEARDHALDEYERKKSAPSIQQTWATQRAARLGRQVEHTQKFGIGGA